MPLFCPALSYEELLDVTRQINDLPATHPLKKDVVENEVLVTEENGVTIFQSASGFYFRKGSPLQAIRDDITTTRHYLCSPFEIDNDPSISERFRSRFQETVGRVYTEAIETVIIERQKKQILLMKLPLLAIRHLIANNGGVLKTAFSGSTEALKTIPTLNHFLRFPDTEETVSSVFATEYPPGEYDKVMAIHNAIVREVVKNQGKGICLKWVARWEV
jgi:hypothetical protein